MAGTPVIASDWGAFTETVEHGRTGYRCRTLDQFVWAARHVSDLDPWYIHTRAVANWSLDRVKWMYEEYFEMLFRLVERRLVCRSREPQGSKLAGQVLRLPPCCVPEFIKRQQLTALRSDHTSPSASKHSKSLPTRFPVAANRQSR